MRRRLLLGLLVTAPLALSIAYLARMSGTLATLSHTESSDQAVQELNLDLGSRPGNSDAAVDYNYPFEPRVPPSQTMSAKQQIADESTGVWQEVSVRPGDNMSLIFSRLGLKYAELHRIIAIGDATKQLKALKPGQKIRILVSDGRIQRLVHEESLIRSLEVTRLEDRFHAQIVESDPEVLIRAAAGIIDNSLFLSGQAAGLSDRIIMQLAEIFGWDVDFVFDIRKGDHFAVVYEEFRKDDRKIRDGEILAAEFVNRGRVLRAVRYTNAIGRADYYADSGAAMRKAFLRTPVNFTRISSRFNLRRRHPVLNTIRAHKGVDYAAPHGTPVKATGDGKIEYVGTNGGYGKMVVLRHGGVYSTAYAHLSRYARSMKQGNSVKQGQVIGYVGQTGLATGPHLHYEFRVNGVHHNPLKVPFPKAEPIANKYLADFKAKAEPLLAQLDALSENITVASRLSSTQPRTGAATSSPTTLASTR